MTTDVHVGDVHAGVAEDRADDADHPWAIVVADDEHVRSRRHVARVVVDEHDALLATAARQRPGDHVPIAAHGDQVQEVDRCRRRHLFHFDAVLDDELRCVDVRNGLVAHRTEDPLQHRQRQDAGVVLGEVAFVADLQLRRHTFGQAREQPAERLTQRQERLDALGRFGSVDVDGEWHELAGQGELDHLGDGVAGLVLRLSRRRAEMRCDDHGIEPEQRALGHRLGREHVERGTTDAAGAYRLGEIVLVDDPTAGDVDDPQIRLGVGKQRGVDDPRRLLRLR